eukprot:COSAG01_NODE_15318_length_1350_cov_1.373301_2_plen_98_part_00
MKAFGDITTFPAEFIKYPQCAAAGARTHPDLRMRRLSKFYLLSAAMIQPCYSTEDWSWDELFLNDDGTLIALETMDFYDFEACHTALVRGQGTWGAY